MGKPLKSGKGSKSKVNKETLPGKAVKKIKSSLTGSLKAKDEYLRDALDDSLPDLLLKLARKRKRGQESSSSMTDDPMDGGSSANQFKQPKSKQDVMDDLDASIDLLTKILTVSTFTHALMEPKKSPKDILPGFEKKLESGSSRPVNVLLDGLAFISYGAQAISQDEFSKCFVQKPRTKFSLELLTVPLYCIGWLFRYFFLFPYRLCLLLTASAFFFLMMPIVLRLKSESLQRWLFRFYCGAFLRSWGSQIRYHGKKPKLNVPHLFVSNHTSVIDYIVLSAHDFPHATVAQTHGGLIGYFEHSVLTLNGSLMFNRNEKKDRNVLTQKMRKHIHNPSNVPLLIFPEGTCVNNEYTVLFHKGAFEMDAAIVPVAIKYNKQWADAYWHSKTQTFTTHILYLMTRWALVADVWYLPPEKLKKGQTSSDFANDVKAKISRQAKLKNLSWDGYFKNFAPAKDKQERMKENPQFRYGAVLMNRMRTGPTGSRPAKFSYLKRSNSICIGEVTQAARASIVADELNQPDWLSHNKTTEARNTVLVKLLDEDGPNDMIQAIADQKSNVLNVWKNYTKIKGDDQQRRLEHISWRLWFKQRREFEKQKLASLDVTRSESGMAPLTPVIVVENALQMLSSTVDYFSLPLKRSEKYSENESH
ncbi:hypothetical protein HDU97_008641 [Phlyctochytrium planicorne]|nr:hypothetical protein HDU97_008641 [Phlyctochytrium planicorne]